MSGVLSWILVVDQERTVSIAPQRLAGWIERFSRQHGDLDVAGGPTEVALMATDGAMATIAVPFPPLAGDTIDDLLLHVRRERRVGVLLVRRRGHAAGIFEGRDLVASKVGSSYVQGTTKAGGWSQQRYARRRSNQTRAAYEQAADDAAMILAQGNLDALVTGGDRVGVRAVLADPRLARVGELVSQRFLTVPDPRQKVLVGVIDQLLGVRIALNALA